MPTRNEINAAVARRLAQMAADIAQPEVAHITPAVGAATFGARGSDCTLPGACSCGETRAVTRQTNNAHRARGGYTGGV